MSIAFDSEGGAEFSNNLISDLAPIIALFGEQVTRQYLSHTSSLLECIIFACAPIGIITGVICAIRVGGSRSLKALIGRAREPEALAELEVLSSTSPDVCELWNGSGIARVVGSPHILELVLLPAIEGKPAQIHTLQTAVQESIFELREKNAEIAQSFETEFTSPPNISYNVAGGPPPKKELLFSAILGIVLQLGVVIFTGVFTYGWSFNSRAVSMERLGMVVPQYAFPSFACGTALIAVGMFLCAHIVDARTDDRVWVLSDHSDLQSAQIIWLQKARVVSDQEFGSYMIRAPDDRSELHTSRKSERFSTSYFLLLTILGTGLSISGFFLQFVGLRAMHWSVSLAQIGCSLVMTALRVYIRRGLSLEPHSVQRIPQEFELDHVAKEVTGCADWKVRTQMCHGDASSSSSNETLKDAAAQVVATRMRLSHLSGWRTEFFDTVERIASCMEDALRYTFRAQSDIDLMTEATGLSVFEFAIPLSFAGSPSTAKLQQNPTIYTIKAQRKNMDRASPWSIDREELDAVLSLWLSSCTSSDRLAGTPTYSDGWLAIPQDYYWATGEDNMAAHILYDWWIRRGSASLSIPYRTDSSSPSSNIFIPDYVKVSSIQTDLLAAKLRLQPCEAFGQYLLSLFFDKLIGLIDSLAPESTTVEQNLDFSSVKLVNRAVSGMADVLQRHGISTDDSYRLVLPPLASNGKLPDIFERNLEIDIIKRSDEFRQQELADKDANSATTDAWNTVVKRLIWLCGKKAEALIHQDLWTEAGATYQSLKRSLETLYEENAIHLVDSGMFDFASSYLQAIDKKDSIQPPISDKEWLQIPFRLHWAISEKRPDYVLRAIREGAKLDAWNADQNEPIEVALESHCWPILRLLLFFGAPFPKETLETEFKEVMESGAARLGDGKRLVILNASYGNLLIDATKAGKIAILRLLMERRIDLSQTTKEGLTVLHLAAEMGNTEMLELFLKHGANSLLTTQTEAKSTALHLAVTRRHIDAIKVITNSQLNLRLRELINVRDGGGNLSIHLAALKGYDDVIEILLGCSGLDMEARTAGGATALYLAAEAGHLSTVKLLVSRGVKVDAAHSKKRETPLFTATRYGHHDIVEFLLDHQASPDSRCYYGRTPIMLAAETLKPETAMMLLERGADITARDDCRRGPLDYTIIAGGTSDAARMDPVRISLIEWLLEKDPSAAESADAFGRTPLHYAGMYNDVHSIQLIADSLSSTGILDPRDRWGWTPLHYASRNNMHEAINLLEKLGADKEARNKDGKIPGELRGLSGMTEFWSPPLAA
ncbi:ankyrin [Ascobolus immersus RN42]|uniref:Ankyrin n=1 Tax=Ascobolus immersus RN42 TaxID=1160509 RepID=A0A3N4HCG8_ASCIM|nr:ankyrin [Ascobolus immersus RN42]